jgi:hypothetical protein
MTVSGEKDVKGPAEQPAVRTTIVGGRPPGPGKGVGAVPRGIEVLIKKAAVDPGFKALLLAERSAAAAEIGLELSETETAMLDRVPGAQLEAIIANTSVSPRLRPAFMGRAAVMLAALGTGPVVYADVELVSDPTETEITQNVGSSKSPTMENIGIEKALTDGEVGVGILSGRVVNENGAPLVNAAVKIEELDIVEYTDEDGYFIFNDVPIGYYTVKFRYPEHTSMTFTNLKIVADMTTNVNCDLQSTTLGIRPDGAPYGWAD